MSRRAARRPSLTKTCAYLFTGVAAACLLAMIGVFALESWPALSKLGPGYVTGDRWFFRQEEFGALPMVYGTLAVALVALVLAAPLGIGAALCTSELLPRRPRVAVKLAVELLAGIPSVVYGLLGILFLRGPVRDLLAWLGAEPYSGDTLLTAGVLLAVMVLPTVMTLADDALRAVPGKQRAAARGLGLTRAETALFVVVPQAARGLTAAVLLAFGRALGETIAVFLVVGRQDNQLPASWFSLEALGRPGQTLSSKLGGSELHIAQGDALHWGALVGLGLLLLLVALGVTLGGAALARRGGAVA